MTDNSATARAAGSCRIKDRLGGRPSLFEGSFTNGSVAQPPALTVRELGALSDLDNIAVRIADVAARLAVLGYWFRDELRSSTFP